MSVKPGPGTEGLSPLALEVEAPQVIEAEPMLPLQAPSPVFSSPKVAESPGPRRSSAESESAALLAPAAEIGGDPSKSVSNQPVVSGSSSSAPLLPLKHR